MRKNVENSKRCSTKRYFILQVTSFTISRIRCSTMEFASLTSKLEDFQEATESTVSCYMHDSRDQPIAMQRTTTRIQALWSFLSKDNYIYQLLFTSSKDIIPSQSYCR